MKAGAEDGPADEALFSTGITSAWCTPEGPIAIADASSSSVRWIGAGGSVPSGPSPRPQPKPRPGPGKPSQGDSGEAAIGACSAFGDIFKPVNDCRQQQQ